MRRAPLFKTTAPTARSAPTRESVVVPAFSRAAAPGQRTASDATREVLVQLGETSAYTMASSGLYAAGSIFHYAVAVEDPAELDEVASRLASGVARPGGFVAHVGLPIALQTEPHEAPVRARVATVPPAAGPETI